MSSRPVPLSASDAGMELNKKSVVVNLHHDIQDVDGGPPSWAKKMFYDALAAASG